MLTEVDRRGSDDFLLVQLGKSLAAGLPRYQMLRKHMRGLADVLDPGNKSTSETYTKARAIARLNLAESVVTARSSRLVIEGFTTSTVGDSEGDLDAVSLFEDANGPIALSDIVQDSCAYASGLAIVTRGDEGVPLLVRGEHWNTVVKGNALSQWASAALSYSFLEDEGMEVLTLFQPGTQRRAVRLAEGPSLTEESESWWIDQDWSWMDPAPVPLSWTDRVPVVEIDAPGGVGCFETHLDTLNRINTKIYQRLVILVMQAFRQRAIEGSLPDVYPDDDPLGRAGQRIDYDKIFESGPDALWRLPIGSKIWESAVTDTRPLLDDSKDEIKNLAVVTKTPMYMLAPDVTNGSASGADLARETIVDDVKARQKFAGAAVSRIVGLLFAASGRPRSDRVNVVWSSADRVTVVDMAQAASQVKGIVPDRTIWREVLRFTPEQMAQAEQDAADDAFMEVEPDGGEPGADGGSSGDDGRAGDRASDPDAAEPVGATQAG